MAREEGESRAYESTAAVAHLRLTPAGSRVGLAMTGEVEIAREDAAPDRREARKAAGKKLDMGKSCLRFKKVDDLVPDAIGKLVAKMPPPGSSSYSRPHGRGSRVGLMAVASSHRQA